MLLIQVVERLPVSSESGEESSSSWSSRIELNTGQRDQTNRTNYMFYARPFDHRFLYRQAFRSAESIWTGLFVIFLTTTLTKYRSFKFSA